MTKITIISGGQTGADFAGLKAARDSGFSTAGVACRNFKTESGYYEDFLKSFNLVDLGMNNQERTIDNIKNSDLTLIFVVDQNSPGTKLAINELESLKKPFKLIDLTPLIGITPKSPELIQGVRTQIIDMMEYQCSSFIHGELFGMKFEEARKNLQDSTHDATLHDVVINIAGNRESFAPGFMEATVYEILMKVFSNFLEYA